uniref:Uncharacterized protein n=1 Tax=Arundo donax TaxID=35708 RepID=A0A0A9Q6S3_ARUDO
MMYIGKMKRKANPPPHKKH